MYCLNLAEGLWPRRPGFGLCPTCRSSSLSPASSDALAGVRFRFLPPTSWLELASEHVSRLASRPSIRLCIWRRFEHRLLGGRPGSPGAHQVRLKSLLPFFVPAFLSCVIGRRTASSFADGVVSLGPPVWQGFWCLSLPDGGQCALGLRRAGRRRPILR